MLIIFPVLLTALCLFWLWLTLRLRRAIKRFDIRWRAEALADRYHILKTMKREARP